MSLRWRNCLPEKKRGKSKWESWHELAVKSCISSRPRRFQNPRRRRTSQSPSRNVRGGRQWRPIAYISPVSRCSRLLITQEFRPRTRVINGSGPSPRYRGTKLRANLPQPYINPDFLTLLSQRSPSSSSFPPPPSSCWIPPVAQCNEPWGMHHPVSIIRSPASNQIILKSALYSRGIAVLHHERKRGCSMLYFENFEMSETRCSTWFFSFIVNFFKLLICLNCKETNKACIEIKKYSLFLHLPLTLLFFSLNLPCPTDISGT